MSNTPANMNVTASFKHMDASDAVRNYAKEKSEKISKYFHGEVTVGWNFSVERENHIAHCHVTGNSNNVDYFSEAVTSDMYASIDQAIEKLEKQLRKHKEIVKDHLHRNRVASG